MHAVSRILAARLAARHAIAKSRLMSTTPPRFIAHIPKQVADEIATCNTSPAKFCGFFGACCNWFLGLSAIYDASCKGPEVISLKMTGVMLAYSTLFGRWAGWAVTPRNYILAGSHMFNVLCQTNQLRRGIEYKMATGGQEAVEEVKGLAVKAAAGAAFITAAVLGAEKIKSVLVPIGPAYLASPGGPFTIHPWPPMTKLAISGTSLLELDRPTDKISLSQYSALTVTGAIFSRYGLVVTPINYPLTSVNVVLFLSSAWHLGRKIKADYL
jgi:hypothetical protein